MKIFITGVAGFLGSHLADLMIAQGHSVAGNDNMIGGYTDNVPQDVEFHQVDCCDLENMTKAMEGCDIVYHTAATAYEGLSVFSPVLVTRNIFFSFSYNNYSRNKKQNQTYRVLFKHGKIWASRQDAIQRRLRVSSTRSLRHRKEGRGGRVAKFMRNTRSGVCDRCAAQHSWTAAEV